MHGPFLCRFCIPEYFQVLLYHLIKILSFICLKAPVQFQINSLTYSTDSTMHTDPLQPGVLEEDEPEDGVSKSSCMQHGKM